MILGIETSCDETAAAVITADGQVLSSIVASQAELHAHYGGVVPGGRLASPPRAHRAGAEGMLSTRRGIELGDLDAGSGSRAGRG